jgi:hypothetical protein
MTARWESTEVLSSFASFGTDRQILFTLLYQEKLVMKRDTKDRARSKLRQHARPPYYVSIQVPLRAADAKRSVKNILEWNCYLPVDCVRTMVRMGWDYTT